MSNSLTFKSKAFPKQLVFGLQGYAIVGIFSDQGFETNLSVYVLVTKAIHDATMPEIPFKEGEHILSPVGTLTLSLSPGKSTLKYTFDGIALWSKAVSISEHTHAYLLEFHYPHNVMPNEPPDKPHFKNNPITVEDNTHEIKVQNLSGANVKLPNEQDSKALLGLEYLQGTESATVLRLTSRRSKNNSWLKLLNAQNWKPTDRLDWTFDVMKDNFIVSQTTTKKVYYAETYGPLNACEFPPLEEYTDVGQLPGLPITSPLSVVKKANPSRFALDKNRHSSSNKTTEADQNVDDVLETVTIIFETGKYHHRNLARTQTQPGE